jgi:6-phosphogluconate dehydrogenase
MIYQRKEETMELGIVGLGRMGMNMARRLLKGGHRVVAYNRTWDKTRALEREGGVGVRSLEELAQRLEHRRVVWLMLPAGSIVDEFLEKLSGILEPGDLIVDGGNTHYKDDLPRAQFLATRGIEFMDVGVSGGIWGLERGYCLMVGGKEEDFRFLEPIFRSLSCENGYLYCGPTGAGHFVKMVHNGIEYGLMQAYAEGFSLLASSEYPLDLRKVARLWNTGSVVRSWLLELLHEALKRDPTLETIRGYVEDSGEGRWMVQEATEKAVPLPVIAAALFQRFRSRQEDSFSDRVVAALRREFGGHEVMRKISS